MPFRYRPWLLTAAVVIATVVVLRAMGRLWWCACGSSAIWIGDAHGQHTSQHWFDPYSVSHVVHGILFAGLAWLALRKRAFGWQFSLALTLECLWEIVENTNVVIARFRDATAASDYEGDTIANSLGDIFASAIGILLARRLGLWWSVAIVIVLEVVLAVWIRDNLLLNIVMLVFPIEAIRTWQARP